MCISCRYTFQPGFHSRIRHTGFAMGNENPARSCSIFSLKPSCRPRISHDLPFFHTTNTASNMRIPPCQEGHTVLMLSQLCQVKRCVTWGMLQMTVFYPAQHVFPRLCVGTCMCMGMCMGMGMCMCMCMHVCISVCLCVWNV